MRTWIGETLRMLLPAFAAFTAAATITSSAGAAVFLNELAIRGTEKVELHNSGLAAVNVNGWTVQGGGGSWVIVGAPLVPSEGYLSLEVPGDIFTEEGGFIELLDGIVPRDGVSYGQFGSAPLPPGGLGLRASSASLARAPDGAAFTIPPSNSPATDGLIWTIDFTPTFGSANDAPLPLLGTTVLLNDLDPKPLGGGDFVELFNPLAVPVDVTSWLLCNGDDTQALTGSVPGLGYLAFATDPGFDLETNEVLYLFRADEVRVDQLGFHLPPVRSVPTLDYCQCYARWPDGAGPSIGYDWFTSGGEATLFKLVCTPGVANQFEASCLSTSSPESNRQTWGRLKTLWR